jgi:hypothetical protein
MKRLKTRTKTKVLTSNGFVERDNFTSVVFFNQGSDTVYVFNDIKIEPGEEKAFIFPETTVFSENIEVRFSTVVAPQVIAHLIYYDE